MRPRCRELFVYGTLRSDAKSAAHHHWMRGARLVGAATVAGRLYHAGRYPAAVPSDDSTDRIAGELYAIEADRADDLLAALDRYEGYDAEEPEASLFVRAVTDVTTLDGDATQAWIYWFARPIAHLPRVRSGDWLA